MARLTAAGMLMGTPLYSAPEQLRNELMDPRTDLYAAAVVLYEMLSGRAPFSGRNLADMVHAIAYEPPPPLAGAASAALDRVIRIGLAKRQMDRFATADAMARDLRTAMPVPDTVSSAEAPRLLTRLIVLPLRVLRPDAETDFLAFSLADAITNGLSGLRSLVVRSSTAALRFTDSASDLKAIAAEAEVDAVLTGTLLRGGAELRVATQLVEVPAGTVLWSQTAQVPVGDVFRVQDELTGRILDALSIPLTARERSMLKNDIPANPRAYELYLRANEMARETREWRAALDLYERCVVEDPQYAPAWAGLGRVHRMIGKYVDEAPAEHFARAEHAVKRALDLNPDLSMAENVYAYLEVDFGRSEAAMVRLVRRARERPSDPELFAGLAHAARYCGLLHASVTASEQAARLDPAVPTSVAHTFFLSGDYERALERAGDPYIRSLALVALGREDEAAATLQRIDQSVAKRLMIYATALLQMITGRSDESADTIRKVGQIRDPEGRYHVARHLARLEKADEALSFLGDAVRDGFFCVPAFVRDPWIDPLRALPGFAAIMREAEARHRRATISFISAEGDRVLGIEYPV
jgi:TolB-like protein